MLKTYSYMTQEPLWLDALPNITNSIYWRSNPCLVFCAPCKHCCLLTYKSLPNSPVTPHPFWQLTSRSKHSSSTCFVNLEKVTGCTHFSQGTSLSSHRCMCLYRKTNSFGYGSLL